MILSRRILFPAVAALAAAGCGTSDGKRHQAVSGRVTLDGKPLAAGAIAFVPAGPDADPTGGPIRDGAFSIPLADGPAPGAYTVSVYAQKPTGRSFPDPNDPGVTIEEKFEIIPPQYNVNTELKADVKEGGDNTFVYELVGEVTTPPKPGRGKR